jgi:hypothetical protein
MNPLQQLRAPLGTFTVAGPHPSRGGNPYSDDVRYDVIIRFQLGLPLESPELDLLRAQHPPAYPSYQTCERYIQQFQLVGHFQPKQATGNHEATREIEGEAWPRLALYRRLHPQATINRPLLSKCNCQSRVHFESQEQTFFYDLTRETCFGQQTIHWAVRILERRT